MKKLIVLIVLALLGFYVFWPAFSGYQIHAALAAKDTKALAGKINFPSVRKSMREPVMAQISERMKVVSGSLGLGDDQLPKQKMETIVDGALAEVVTPQRLVAIYAEGGDVASEMKRAILGQIDKLGGIGALFDLGGSTPTADSDVKKDDGGGLGGAIGGIVGGVLGSDKVRSVVTDITGKVGSGIGGAAGGLFPEASPKQGAVGEDGSSSYGLGNIKGFGFDGPLGLYLGLAKSSAAADPDVTAHMGFENFDWRVTKLIPNLSSR